MGFAYFNNQVDIDFNFNAAITTTGTSSTAFDRAVVEGSFLASVNVRSGGTNEMAISIEHSDASGSGFTAVPAAALINTDTGVPATFASVTAGGGTQTLGLRADLLKRYVRFTFSGASLTQNASAVFAFQRKYTES
jgi:hypothetical protein